MRFVFIIGFAFISCILYYSQSGPTQPSAADYGGPGFIGGIVGELAFKLYRSIRKTPE